MIWLILILVIFAVVLSIALYAVASRRIVQSVSKTNSDETRVKNTADNAQKQIQDELQKDSKDITNADKKQLLDTFRSLLTRDRMRP